MSEEKRPIELNDVYRMISVEDPQISPDGHWVAFVKVMQDKMENAYIRNIWLCDTAGGEPVQITRGGKDSQPRWSPDGTQIAFMSVRNDKPQIYVLPVKAPGGEARAITSMPNGAHSADWSPDGTQIAFLSPMTADERAKEDTGEQDDPPADKLEAKHRKERREDDEKKRQDPYFMWRVPYRVGTSFVDGRYAQVYIAPVAEGLEGDEAKPRRLTDLDADYHPPRWSPDGKTIYTARQIDIKADSPFRNTGLFRINVAQGSETPIVIEDHTCFAPEPSPDGKWIAFARLPNDNDRSITESIDRLAIIPADGGEALDLNLELDRSVTDYAWAADSSAVVFSAETEGTAPVYRAPVDGSDVRILVSGEFITMGLDVADDGAVAFVSSTPLSPPELNWLPAGSTDFKAMTAYNQKFLDEVIVQQTHEMWFTTPSGNRIQGWYILPVDYEEDKQYPLALNMHGGPHVMWGASTDTMFHEWQLHAARGYVVFYCNPRGAGGYGESFQKALHSAWGDVAFEDVMAGVDAMLEKGFVDPNRMAITGGSYAGYLTAWTIGHTDRFACAVSQRGVYNLISFFGTSDAALLIPGEFDVFPWEDHEKLWSHSPVAYADKIKTPLLLIHSENDFRVPIEQAEQLFAFVRFSGGTVEMWRYPREGHELSRSGEPEHRISRLEKMIDWFDRYCKPE